MTSAFPAGALPPVILYAAMNPGATARNTVVAPCLNVGLTAAEAAGAEIEVQNNDGWNWGTKTATAMFLGLIVTNFLASKLAPGWTDFVPDWVFIAYLFVIMPAFALTGMIMARISGRRYLRWLTRARELATSHGDKILYCGDLPAEDQEAVSLLLGRIETARQRLLAGPALPADAESKVFAALTALGAFLVHPAPEPLPAMLGMLDSDIETLRARHQAAEAAAQAAFEKVLSTIEELETLAAAAPAPVRALAPEPSDQ
jgi:hypothetical protein